MKDPKWERLEPGVYRWAAGNSKGDYMIWIERGCDTHAKYPTWYWTVVNLGEKSIIDKQVGSEFSLADAKVSSLAALHGIIQQAIQHLNGGRTDVQETQSQNL